MTEPIRKFHGAAVIPDQTLTDRQIRVIASDATPDRVADIMVPAGCRLDSFKSNPIVLANHDAEKPIGTADVSIKNNRVEALIDFAPPRISAIADEFCALAKAGILRAVSVGFQPIESEPIRGGGVKYVEWDLLELSVVSVPANPSALVIERSAHGAVRRVSNDEWSRVLTKQDRRVKIRDAIRAEGLVKLSDDGWRAFLASEFPDLDEGAALHEYLGRKRTMTLHARFLETKRESDFAKKYAKVDELRAQVQQQVRDQIDQVKTEDRWWTKGPAYWVAHERAIDEERCRALMQYVPGFS